MSKTFTRHGLLNEAGIGIEFIWLDEIGVCDEFGTM